MAALRILAVAAAAAAAALAGRWALAPAPAGAPGGLVEIRLGAADLRVPAADLRRRADIAGGAMDEVEIVLDARALAAGESGGDAPAGDPAEDRLHVTLLRTDATLDPAERFEKLYARFLQAEAPSPAPGLTLRRFEAGSPYENEELFFNPPEGRLFAARCLRTADGEPPGQCLADLRVGRVDVRLRFARRWLAAWDRMTAAVTERVAGYAR